MAKLIIIAALLFLLGLKFAATSFNIASPSITSLKMACWGVSIFGSPQIFWLLKCVATNMTTKQLWTGTELVAVFVISSVYFGYFPGTSPPSWGGDARFDIPAGLAIEWVIATLALIPFHQASTTKA